MKCGAILGLEKKSIEVRERLVALEEIILTLSLPEKID